MENVVTLAIHQKKKSLHETVLRAALHPKSASDLIFFSMVETFCLTFDSKLSEKELRRLYLYSIFIYKERDSLTYSQIGCFYLRKFTRPATKKEIEGINESNVSEFVYKQTVNPEHISDDMFQDKKAFKWRNYKAMAFFYPLSDDYAGFHRNLLADFVVKSEVNVTKSKKKADVQLNQWCFFSAVVNWLMFKNHDYTCYYGYCDGYLHSWLVHDGEIVEPTPYKNRDEYIGIEIDAKKMLAKFMGGGLKILLGLSIKQRYKFLKYCTKRGRQEMLKMLKRAKSAIDDVKSQEKISV